jgi:hypothetical protein
MHGSTTVRKILTTSAVFLGIQKMAYWITMLLSTKLFAPQAFHRPLTMILKASWRYFSMNFQPQEQTIQVAVFCLLTCYHMWCIVLSNLFVAVAIWLTLESGLYRFWCESKPHSIASHLSFTRRRARRCLYEGLATVKPNSHPKYRLPVAI